MSLPETVIVVVTPARAMSAATYYGSMLMKEGRGPPLNKRAGQASFPRDSLQELTHELTETRNILTHSLVQCYIIPTFYYCVLQCNNTDQ